MNGLPERAVAQGPALVASLLRDFAADGVTAEDFGLTYQFYPTPLRAGDYPQDYAAGRFFGYRDRIAVYPASTCKAFYLVAFWHWIETGLLAPDAEDFRALAAMIQQSSNDATTYILGRLTATTPGPCLPPAEMAAWWEKRQAVQRYFEVAHPEIIAGCRLWHSTYEDSPYGREKIARLNGGNLVHPHAAAMLMHDIVRGKLGSAKATQEMMALLDREPERDADKLPPYYQDSVRAFMGEALPRDVGLWSKAGHTSETRHDMVYIEWPDGVSCIAAIYTTGLHMALNERFLPAFTRNLMALRKG
ncbi:MAG TPA: serine hydrolase [Terriglobia bacterium]|nr:serine hydrolase [Terriglobia bacterium]